MKAGILFGPGSGEGASSRAEDLLAQRLRGQSVAVCKGIFQGGGGRSDWTALDPLSGANPGYVDELRGSVAALCAWGAELLVCVGGDGLASYAADAMLAGPRPMTLLGVAAGTINVGPIVSMDMEALAAFDPERLSPRKICAVEALVDGVHLAYGFNDVVIGDSFLGTLDGRVVSLSVKAMLERGTKEEILPSARIAGPGFSVRKNGHAIPSGLEMPAQIVVSPLGRREFYARAVAGILCEAPFMEGASALALFDSVIVKAGQPLRGISDFSTSEQLLFGPGDRVEVEGLASDGQIVVDGNPFPRRGRKVQFRSAPDLADVAWPAGGADGGSPWMGR